MNPRLPWILLALSMALNIAFVGGFAYARFFAPQPLPPIAGSPGPGGAPGGHPGQIDVARDLNLDEAQRRAFRQFLGEMRRGGADRLRELGAIREGVAAELAKPRPDLAAVDRSIDRASVLRADLQKESLRSSLRFAETLRPEQQEKFRQSVAQRILFGPPAGAMQRGPRRDGPPSKSDGSPPRPPQ